MSTQPEISSASPPASQSNMQPSSLPGVIILGGAHGALAVARSMGRRRIPSVLVTDDHPLPKLSRYVSKRFDWAGPASPDAAQWLIDLAAREGLKGWLLVPCTDGDVHLIASQLERLSDVFRVMSCPWETLQNLCDKQMLSRHAQACGVDFPRAYTIASDDDARNLDVQFPVVLKPATRESANAFTMAKAWRADSREELITRYREAADHVGAGHVVVQEFIPGGGDAQYSYAAVWQDGRPLVEMVARRTRQFPVEFSYTSTFVETATREPVIEASRKLLSAVDFRGLVEIEYKFDARDGRHKVMDVNPRAWSWLALPAAAGVDMPHILFQAATGAEVHASAAPRPAAWIHGFRDVLSVMQLVRRGEISLMQWMKSLRGKPLVFASFAWDDPVPGLCELPIVALRVLTRRLPLLLGRLRPR